MFQVLIVNKCIKYITSDHILPRWITYQSSRELFSLHNQERTDSLVKIRKTNPKSFICDCTLNRLIAGEDFNAGDYEWMVEFDSWQVRLEISRQHYFDILSTLRQHTLLLNWFRSSFHRVPRWPSKREINPLPPTSVNARSTSFMPSTHTLRARY